MENQTNSQSNPISDPQPNTVSKKTNPLPKILVAIFFIALIVFGAYYLGKQSSTAEKVVENIQSSPTPYSSPTSGVVPTVSDVTDSWETYSSSEYSFKHPQGLESDTGAAGTGSESIRFQLMGPKQIASGRTQTSIFDGYAFVVTKIGLVTEKTPQQWATERRGNLKDNCGPDFVLSDVEEITIDKGTGVQYSIKNCMGDYTSSYISNGTNVYEITQLYVGEEADQKAYKEITYQMFASLIFL